MCLRPNKSRARAGSFGLFIALATALLLSACEKTPTPASESEPAPATELEVEAEESPEPNAASLPTADESAGEGLPPGWQPAEAGALNSVQQAQLERAETARDELARTLMGRVMGVVQEQGAPAAVEVCHAEAGPLTAQVADKHGVRIGRTSEKLRNTDNNAPAWAQPLVNASGEARVGVGPQQELALLSPIRIAAPCLSCHGERESLAPEVARKIAEL